MSNQVSTETLRTLCSQASKHNAVQIKIGTIDGNEILMLVKKHLTMKNFGQFVYDMYNAEFTDDGFLPSSGAILFKINLIGYYTNINLPEDVALAYEMITSLGLDSLVISVISETQQYNDLITAVENAMDYRKQKAFAESKTVSEDAIESFVSMINGGASLIENINGVVNSVDISKITEVIQAIPVAQLETLVNLISVGRQESESAVM